MNTLLLVCLLALFVAWLQVRRLSRLDCIFCSKHFGLFHEWDCVFSPFYRLYSWQRAWRDRRTVRQLNIRHRGTERFCYSCDEATPRCHHGYCKECDSCILCQQDDDAAHRRFHPYYA